MNRRTKQVCAPCRAINMPSDENGNCTTCGTKTEILSYRWRPPTKNNNAAWKLIEQGDWLWDKRLLDRLGKFQQNRLAFRWAKNIENYEATTRLLNEINEFMSVKDMAKVFNSDVKHVNRWLDGGGVPGKIHWRIVDLNTIVQFVNDSKKVHSLVPALADIFWKRHGRYYRTDLSFTMDELGLGDEWRANKDERLAKIREKFNDNV